MTGLLAIGYTFCGRCGAIRMENCKTPSGRRLHHSQTHAMRFQQAMLEKKRGAAARKKK